MLCSYLNFVSSCGFGFLKTHIFKESNVVMCNVVTYSVVRV